MANTNAPMGFRLYQFGGKRAPKTIERSVAAARADDLFPGDAYELDTNGLAIRAVAANTAHGIVMGISLNPKSGSTQGPESQDYIPLADAGAIIGCEDPDAIFEVQLDAPYVAADMLGFTFDLLNTDGDQALGQSRQQLDATTVHASAGEFKLVGTPDRVDNDTSLDNPKVLVRLIHTL